MQIVLRNCGAGLISVFSKPTVMAMSRPSSDMAKFRDSLEKAKNIVILTGAGVSAESGIPTFRGAGGLWRKFQATGLATPAAFINNPSLVWEFYHHRRESAMKALPNNAHNAITSFEATAQLNGKRVTVITQNVDDLHGKSGSKNVIELHGNLYKTRCMKCANVLVNHDNPICEALLNRGDPAIEVATDEIPVANLPHCNKPNCNGLLRPHIVWFGENLDQDVMRAAEAAMDTCDVVMVVGTSSVVYPAAMFAPAAARRGAVVAEFNIEPTPHTLDYDYYFEGPCGTTIPQALSQ